VSLNVTSRFRLSSRLVTFSFFCCFFLVKTPDSSQIDQNYFQQMMQICFLMFYFCSHQLFCIPHGGNCYYLSTIRSSWTDSRRSCVDQKSDLGRLRGLMVDGEDRFWIGLTDSVEEGRWFWVDGSDLDQRFDCSGNILVYFENPSLYFFCFNSLTENGTTITRLMFVLHWICVASLL
uniref:C-type lectin domain family 4 member A-like n=1 Tax=Poecilia reticulata TaxID=8081 RepID=A0A3P9NQC9_POERE